MVENPVAGSAAWRASSAGAALGCVSSVMGCESSEGADADAMAVTMRAEALAKVSLQVGFSEDEIQQDG